MITENEMKIDHELLEKLKPLPGQLVIIEHGDFVGLRGAISSDLGVENTNTLSYYIDGNHLGTEVEGQPTVDIAHIVIEALEKTKHPIRVINTGSAEEDEFSLREYLGALRDFLEGGGQRQA